jgi:hypothetical protein
VLGGTEGEWVLNQRARYGRRNAIRLREKLRGGEELLGVVAAPPGAKRLTAEQLAFLTKGT